MWPLVLGTGAACLHQLAAAPRHSLQPSRSLPHPRPLGLRQARWPKRPAELEALAEALTVLSPFPVLWLRGLSSWVGPPTRLCV